MLSEGRLKVEKRTVQSWESLMVSSAPQLKSSQLQRVGASGKCAQATHPSVSYSPGGSARTAYPILLAPNTCTRTHTHTTPEPRLTFFPRYIIGRYGHSAQFFSAVQ